MNDLRRVAPPAPLRAEDDIGPVPSPGKGLRVAIVTATVYTAGGAEKQAFYIARALIRGGVEVRVYSLTAGGYEHALRRIGADFECFGRLPSPPLRLLLLTKMLRRFRPHVIQSMHAYTNIYSAVAGRLLGAISVGGLRSSLSACLAENGHFARSLLTWPDAIAVNSQTALRDMQDTGLLNAGQALFLPNAIDIEAFSTPARHLPRRNSQQQTCICVSRLFPAKRVDVFVRALAAARQSAPHLLGVVVGFGPELPRLQELATELGLLPDAIRFLGRQEDVAALLQNASMFVFCSESEGTPNVILEALAAGLPVITTPVGDATNLVESAGAGYVVPFGDVAGIARKMVRLGSSANLRAQLGRAGRSYVVENRGLSELEGRLFQVYADAARVSKRQCGSELACRFPQNV